MKKFLAPLLSLAILLSIGASLVYAQPGSGNPPTGGGNPPTEGGNPPTGGGNPTASSSGVDITLDNPFKGGDSLFALLNTIINEIIFPIGGVLAILAFIYAGFKYVTAQGDTIKIKEAHQTLLYVVIGTAILLGARLISEVISGTIDQLK